MTMRLPESLLETDRSRRLAWKLLSTGSGVVGAVLARNVMQKLWAAASSSDIEPPLNPADRRIGWRTALQWAAAAGLGAGISRLASQRIAAAGWEAATGTTPPGVAR